MYSQNFLERNHNVGHSTVELKQSKKVIGVKKLKIKCSKANDTVSYKTLKVARMTTKFKEDNRQKLKNLVHIISNMD